MIRILSFLKPIALAAILYSCADHSIQNQLERADSLMWSAPDSAYRILQSISPDTLNSEALQAYFGLLYTQAQYKNYIPITSDSLILGATLYFEERDRHKYGLSLYYLGAVYLGKEFYDLAIEQYKKALEYIDSEKYPKIVATLHTSIGSVYGTQYFERESIAHYKRALRLFQKLGDSTQISAVHKNASKSYAMTGQLDSAILYCIKSFDFAHKLKDSIRISEIQYSLAWILTEQEEIIEAEKALHKSRVYTPNRKPQAEWWQLKAQLALKEGKPDSALYFLDQNPQHTLYEDRLRSTIHQSKGEYRKAFYAFRDYFNKTNAEWKRRNQIRVDEVAARYDYQKINEQKEQLAQDLMVWITVGSLSLGLIILLGILFAMRHKQHRIEARNLNEAMHMLRQTISQDHSKLRILLEKRVAMIATLAEWSYLHQDNEKAFAKKVHAMIEQNPLNGKEADQILETINKTSNGLIDHLQQTHTALNESELLVCALTYMGYTSHQLYVLLSARSVQTVYDKKHKIARKMQEAGDLKRALDLVAATLAAPKTGSTNN